MTDDTKHKLQIGVVYVMVFLSVGLFMVAQPASQADANMDLSVALALALVTLVMWLVYFLVVLVKDAPRWSFFPLLACSFVIFPFCWATILVVLTGWGVCLKGVIPIQKLDILYFSYVTSTTTGYGDISPLGICRLVSVAASLVGLLSFGLLIGLVMRDQRGEAAR